MSFHKEGNESWLVGYCYTVNFIIGSGILGVPSAFYSSGWGLGILCQLITSIISLTSAYQLLSAWSRTEAMVHLIEKGERISSVQINDIFKSIPKDKLEPLLQHSAIPEIKSRKFELYDMIRISLGNFYAKLILFIFVIAMYPWLAGYISIFSASLASNVPLFGLTCNLYETTDFLSDCKYVYWTYLSIFCVYILVISCFHLHEHKYMQITLTMFRFFVVFVILSTCIYAIFTDSKLESPGANDADPPIANPENVFKSLFMIIFASVFQNGIPTTTSIIKDKSDMKKLINSAILTFNVVYLMLGMVVGFAIKNPHSMVSLNFRNYSAGELETDRAWWTYIVSNSVIFLPALDVMSGFPLVASNFTDNLLGMVYGTESHKVISKV